jgi:hypothetical protein
MRLKPTKNRPISKERRKPPLRKTCMTRHKTLRDKIAAVVMAAGLLFAAAPAGAMTGLEFLQAEEDNSHRDITVMKSLVIQFVSQGYRDVPDWEHLSFYTHQLILQKGYRDKDVAEIAEEAALAHGMRK